MLHAIPKYMKINLLSYLKFDKLCCTFCFTIYPIGYTYTILFLTSIGIHVYNHEESYLCPSLLSPSSDPGFACKASFSFCFKMHISNIKCLEKKRVKVTVNVNAIYYTFIAFCEINTDAC